MSIYGIGNSNVGRPAAPGTFHIRDNTRTPQPTALPTKSVPGTAGPTSAATTQSVPVEAPPGTDPALWSVLSGEERAFFAKAGAMGPLTYGRAFSEMKSAQLPVARGGRLDVKI
jgi:hypothetical protein